MMFSLLRIQDITNTYITQWENIVEIALDHRNIKRRNQNILHIVALHQKVQNYHTKKNFKI